MKKHVKRLRGKTGIKYLEILRWKGMTVKVLQGMNDVITRLI